MKIVFSEDEMVDILKGLIPNGAIMNGMKIKEVEGRGYPLKEFVISLEKEEKE